MIYFLGIATAVSTFLGGVLALRLRERLHLLLGFSAGAVLGVAFFDLFPEAIRLAEGHFRVSVITSLVAAAFLIYVLLDRAAILHAHYHEDCEHCSERRGFLGAGSLSLHSFLDGVGIGLAFQVSRSTGIVVAVAVLVHDFSDGINTVNLVLKSRGSRPQARRWLIADALAPLAGVLSTRFFSLSDSAFGLALAIFCGFFFYIGASELLPESHHSDPRWWTTISTALGMSVIYAAVRFAGG